MWPRYLRVVRLFWIGTGSRRRRGAGGRSSYLALLALQPGESAGGCEWVSNTPARTEETDRRQHPIVAPTLLATPELMLHPENRVSWLPGAIGRIIGNELKIAYLI